MEEKCLDLAFVKDLNDLAIALAIGRTFRIVEAEYIRSKIDDLLDVGSIIKIYRSNIIF